MQKEAEEHQQLANDLREALAEGALKVYYQPIIDLQSGRVVKAEALIRWHHPTLGEIIPPRFIPIAEETGQINILGSWIFRQSAMVAKKWVDWAVADGDLELAKLIRISVNKSPKQFHSHTTFSNWVDILKEIDLHPSHMVIEITENLFLGDHVDIAQKLQRFRDVGMALSLDDFGTGYSSLGYLKKYEVDYLKMDQSFVRGMLEQASDRAIAEAILAMAQRLGLDVVAEGIEHPDQRDFLANAGCRYGQGFLFWKPMPEEEFLALVTNPNVRV
jgi:EAL domain-containing protein (putative c-di-GMP-specific phosphodiesterase class I)